MDRLGGKESWDVALNFVEKKLMVAGTIQEEITTLQGATMSQQERKILAYATFYSVNRMKEKKKPRSIRKQEIDLFRGVKLRLLVISKQL